MIFAILSKCNITLKKKSSLDGNQTHGFSFTSAVLYHLSTVAAGQFMGSITPCKESIHECVYIEVRVLTLSLRTLSSQSKIYWHSKNKQRHSKVLLNSFPMNGHTLGFCTWSQKLENFVSPKVSLWESKG